MPRILWNYYITFAQVSRFSIVDLQDRHAEWLELKRFGKHVFLALCVYSLYKLNSSDYMEAFRGYLNYCHKQHKRQCKHHKTHTYIYEMGACVRWRCSGYGYGVKNAFYGHTNFHWSTTSIHWDTRKVTKKHLCSSSYIASPREVAHNYATIRPVHWRDASNPTRQWIWTSRAW